MPAYLRYWFRALMLNNYLRDRRIAQLINNERLSLDELRYRQESLLRRSLHAATKKLNAYRVLDIPEKDIICFLRTLPSVTKHDLLADQKGYYPSLGLERSWTPEGLTSGTTGTPLTIFRSLDSIIWESAFIHRHWTWSGFTGKMKRATLRGDSVVAADKKLPPFWFYNRAENQLLLSSRHLQVPYIDLIVEQLRSFAPHLLQAYPSTAFELALHLERSGDYLSIPYVYTGSEMLYPYQRELISSRLKARVMDFYGMAERVAFASQCQEGNYHMNLDYSYVEIVDDLGNPTNGPGYVEGTTFHNLTMPLVKYRLTDRTRWKPGACPCKRTYPMIEPITGKYEDTVYGSNGNPISPSLITFAFKGLRNIERSQVAQIGDGHWEIRVVPMQGYGKQDHSELIKNFHQLVDPNLKISVVECDEIARTEAGKYRWVVNELPSSHTRFSSHR